MKVTLEQNQLILSIAKQIPCKTLKKASKDTPCGLKGCDRCARWYLERALGLKLEIVFDEPPQEPCEYCASFNGILNAFGFINIDEVGSFCEPHCMNCGRKLTRECNHT